jgi:hypothetical protein
MPRQILRDFRMHARPGEIRNERVPQGTEIGVLAIGIVYVMPCKIVKNYFC